MRTFWSVVALLLCAALGFSLGRSLHRYSAPIERIETHTDTLIVHDTTHIEHFREVTKMTTDTMYIVKTKVVTVHDTEYIPVPKETITVKDPQFTAQISGFNPSLDWIDIYSQTQVITRSETVSVAKNSPWSIGATLGPSVLITPSGRLYGGLGVTTGISYRF